MTYVNLIHNKQVIQKWQKRNIISYLGETEDVRPYLEDSSCLVFPSFYNEGISRILLEAAAMAKPIITTDNVVFNLVNNMRNVVSLTDT